MLIDGISRQSIESNDNYKVKIIDQTLLPHELKYITLNSFSDCCKAIKDMWVRGAPLIGITASYGMFFCGIRKPKQKKFK